ncbi:MAG: pentapeptide repeat-containing protein [Cyanobacteria bacterium J06638_20]
MTEQNASRVAAKKSTSIWKRPINCNFFDLGTAVAKGAISGVFGNWEEASRSGVEVLEALELEPKSVEVIAWVLVQRSLMQAMANLVQDYHDLLPIAQRDAFKPDMEMLGRQLDQVLAKSELTLSPNFFKCPKDLFIVRSVQKPFCRWLQTHEVPGASAKAIADRLPRYFVFALNEQWRVNSEDYARLQEALDTPFTQASEREFAWMLYVAWLQKRVDEPLFAESFSLRQVYVPLRAYYEVPERESKQERDVRSTERSVTRHVVDLQTELLDWIQAADKDDAIRVICGGPGCGKSSFSKMLAATLAETETIPVFFIPLHQFDPTGDLVDAIERFIREDLDGTLPPHPLAKESAEPRVLLIFDGLDELAMQGAIAAQVAQEFVREVQKKLIRFNQNQTRVLALLSGREVVVQPIQSEFRKAQQVLYVLPYHLTQQERDNHRYQGNESLLNTDQRHQWWKAYGQLKGQSYTELPEDLSHSELEELTAQPLLNYLVALSYERGELDFSVESNLNAIYHDLLRRVYQRDWADNPHPALQEVKQEEQFIRFLEEIAIACWHGNGRTTTVGCIAERCTSGTLKRILEAFEAGANEGVTRLLTAFYFCQSGIQGSEATFEFTHKSFGEYLTARRIVREVRMIQEELDRHQEDADRGWDERECLKRWVLLCGQAKLGQYILRFFNNEVRLQPIEQVHTWQQTLCGLINVLLRQQMPMEDLHPRPSYREERRQARNAEEALLAALAACAVMTEKCSSIDWPSTTSAREWLMHLQGEHIQNTNPIDFAYFSYMELSQQNLSGLDLTNVNLDGARLQEARLQEARLNRVSLEGACLEGAWLDGARLREANLNRAILDRARLEDADLNGASLEEANLDGAWLVQADLSGANLNRASLNGANLEEASLEEASLEDASLKDAILDGASLKNAWLNRARLDWANLNRASLEDASLEEARLGGWLIEANLNGASLNGANLDGANLDRANLDGANLDGASLDRVSLNGANLDEANLDGTSLNGASLDRASLDRASLDRASLNRANLNEASLNGASLDGASLDGAIGLTEEQLTQAKLCRTKLPEGIDLDANRDCLEFDDDDDDLELHMDE